MKTQIIVSAIAWGLVQSATGPVAKAQTAMGGDGIECHGGNSCKGKGDCGGKGTSCAGTNACKGKGWVTTKTQAECDGLIAKVKASGKAKSKANKG